MSPTGICNQRSRQLTPPFIIAVLYATSATWGQPTHTVEGKTYATVPERVLVHPGGTLEVQVHAVEVPAGGRLEDVCPTIVPVFELLPDGRLQAGLTVRNDSGVETAAFRYIEPWGVSMTAEGTEYVVDARRRYRTNSHGTFLPDYVEHLEGSETVSVLYGIREDPFGMAAPMVHHRAPGWTITFQPDIGQFDAAFGEASRADMLLSLDRVKVRVENVLLDSVGNVNVVINFAPTPANRAATTTLDLFDSNWGPVIGHVFDLAEANSEEGYEITLYGGLPSGGVPFVHTNGFGTDTATRIAYPPALGRHLQVGIIPPGDGTTTISTGRIWDWDALDGPRAATDEDFEAVMTHEVFHVVGFQSLGDEPNIPHAENVITIWDAFRFPNSAGPTISDAELSSVARELRPMQAAIFASAINDANSVYPAAQGSRAGGDDDEPQHWKRHTALTPPVPVGIMDPSPTAASAANGGRYYKLPDLRALDIIGWNLNSAAIRQGASIIPLGEPQDGVALASATPTFTWGPDDENFKWHLWVFSETSTAPADNVITVLDLLDTTFTVPIDQALPAGLYTWLIAGENETGYVYSATRTFTISTQVCAVDFNDNGVADVPDILRSSPHGSRRIRSPTLMVLTA